MEHARKSYGCVVRYGTLVLHWSHASVDVVVIYQFLEKWRNEIDATYGIIDLMTPE